MRAALDWIYRLSAWAAAFFLLAIVVLTIAQIVGRLVGVLVPVADEFAGFCLAATSFLALAATFRSGEHVRVALVLGRLAPVGRRRLELWALGAGFALTGYFAFFSVIMAWESWQFAEVAQGLVPTPLWLPQAGMALGVSVLALAMADDLVALVVGREPSYRRAEAKVGLGPG